MLVPTEERTVFDKSVDLYDALYRAAEKDYRAEADEVLRRVAAAGVRPASLLDVACGTGGHLQHFAAQARCVGIDVDPEMVAAARTRCPGARIEVADMVDFDLGEQFDVVTCLFSSIGYAGTTDRLGAAVASMARHLLPGGVLTVEPWFQPDAWRVGHLSALFVDEPELKAARLAVAEREDDVAVLDFHYLVLRRTGVEHFTERHELTLFTWTDYRDAFTSAGLAVEVDESGLSGRGLVVGRRPASTAARRPQ
jgi:SAM-dependent methyltransferase